MLRGSVKWCFQCNVPILGEYCSLCGGKGRDCATDLKPVFNKERELLERLLGVDIPPYSFRHRNRIIVNGRTYLNFRIDTQREKFIVMNKSKHNYQNYGSDKNMIDRVIKANQEILKKKEVTAVEFIKRVHEKFPHSEFVALFGGGKDSAVTAILAKKALGKVPLLFIDTTLEFPETYEYVETFSNTHGFVLLKDKKDEFYRSDQDFFELCKRLGPPSIYCRWCCHIFKERPVRDFINEKKDVDLIFLTGIRKLESRRRGNYLPIEPGKRIKGQTLVQPIIDWKDFEVWLYLLWKKIKINELYKVGHARVGCWPCPCTPPIMDLMRRITHRHLWTKFEKILLDFANKNNRSEEWVKRSFWRLRRPKRQRFIIDPIAIEDEGEDILFTYRLPCKNLSLEHFKVIGDLEINNGLFEVKSSSIEIIGKIQKQFIELKVKCGKSKYIDLKKTIERVISRSMNCIGCGSCTTSCPRGALKAIDGHVIITEECNKCKTCLEITCAVEDSEKFFAIKMDPFIVHTCEKGLNMNRIIFFNSEIGRAIAERLSSMKVNVEIHDDGKIVCVDENFPRWRLEKIVTRCFQ